LWFARFLFLKIQPGEMKRNYYFYLIPLTCRGFSCRVLRLPVFFLFAFLLFNNSEAQILPEYTVVEGVDPVTLVQQYLIGEGVETSNITYTGNDLSRGRFFGESNIGVDAGVLLTSGRAQNSKGPNNSGSKSFDSGSPGDVALNQLSGSNTLDACVLEFDFVPQSSLVEFKYVFASEEYPEYANSSYNDVFGFFISGPGIAGPYPAPPGFPDGAKNIAILPELTSPPVYVSINNINNGTSNNGPCEYCQYYVNNGIGNNPTVDKYIQYDGFTTVLVARANVIPCQTYHIKLSVADISDRSYDSGVFLEANSFSSVGVQSSLTFTHAVVDTAVENCNTASLRFRIDNVRSEPFIIHYDLGGTALNGVDYEQIPDSVIIPTGQQEVFVDIIPIVDDLPEPTKVVEIIYNTSFCEYIPDTALIWIKDYPQFELLPSNPQSIECGQSVFIRAGANGGIEPWDYLWNSGNPADTTDIIEVFPLVSTDYIVEVTDVCGNSVEAVIPVEVRGPVAVISQGDEINICLYDDIDLSVEGGTSWLWSTGETTPTINVAPTVNTVYSVTASDDCGNTDYTEILVTVGQPFAEAGEYEGICVGQLVELIANDTPSGVWVWTDMLSGDTYNGRIVTVSPATSRQYCVDVTDNCGNTVTDCTDIEVFQLTANAGTDPVICAGDMAELSGSSSTGSGTFRWTDGTNTYTGQVVQVSPLTTTTYTLTVDDGCEATDEVTVNVNPLPLVTALASVPAICPDESVNLTAAGAVSYEWTASPGDLSLSDPLSANPFALPLETTTYTVTGTDANGCTNTAEVLVQVKERMFADFNISQPAVCEGDEVVITYTGNALDYAAYDWNFDGGSVSGMGQGPLGISWTGPGTKTVSLTVTQEACVSEMVSQTIEVNAMPVAAFSYGITSGCQPLEAEFTSTSTGILGGTTFSWDFGSAGTDAGASVSRSFEQSGIYDVTLTVTNPGGCIDQAVSSGLVEVWPLPEAGFENSPPFASMKNPVINFASTSEGEGLTYTWDPGDGTIVTDSAFSHIYADSGYYQAVLTVENLYGCKDVFEKTIYISPRYALKIPTAFTPNGDGRNDEFRVTGNGVKEYRINIYNRWGALVFTSDNISESWNGRAAGNDTGRGMYVYHIFFRDENDEVSEFTGSIVIVR